MLLSAETKILLEGRYKKKQMSKTKTDSSSLSNEEISDIKQARMEKGKIYNDVEELIKDLHKNVTNLRD